MKKFTSFLTVALMALMSLTFTSCDEDAIFPGYPDDPDSPDIAYTLDGTWKGNLYVEYDNYDAEYTVIRFDQNDGLYSGTGYWINYFNVNYWGGHNYIANRIRWTVRNGNIYIDLLDEEKSVVIFNYGLNDRKFFGYINDRSGNRAYFEMYRDSYGYNWRDYAWGDTWHDHYGWYDDYNHGGWGWNQGDWNQGSQGSKDQDLLDEAQTLVGDWYGKVQLSELAEDGNSRNNYEFEANMIFYQDKNNANSLSGNGVEVDYATDDSGDTQTLKFSWYIDNNGDIYIKYTSGTTYVMDAGASQYGFHLGKEDGKQNDTFFGYMIGTGIAKGDIMYIDLERNTSSTARILSRSASSESAAKSAFGASSKRNPITGTIKKIPSKR